MIDVLLVAARKDSDFYEGNKAIFQLHFAELDVNCSLKCSWRLAVTKLHTPLSVSSQVLFEHTFILIFGPNRYLPILSVCIELGEHNSLSEAVNSVLHLWQWVCIRSCDSVQIYIVDTKAEPSVFFGDQDHS